MREFFYNNRYAIIYALVALLFVVLILTIGFWRSLLITVIITAGFLLGRIKDNNQSISDFFSNLFRK